MVISFPFLPVAATHSMFDMDVARCAPYMEHDGSFNMLHAVVAYMDQFQKGLGAVAVSPRCGVGWLGEAV